MSNALYKLEEVVRENGYAFAYGYMASLLEEVVKNYIPVANRDKLEIELYERIVKLLQDSKKNS